LFIYTKPSSYVGDDVEPMAYVSDPDWVQSTIPVSGSIAETPEGALA
jgi:hypothetical protein